MATGRSTKLTGALGEYLVAAELSRRGFIAAPFACNVPHFDILARLPLQFHPFTLAQIHHALDRHDDASELIVTVH